MTLVEAKENGGKIVLNGWTRWLVSSLWGLLMAGLVLLANNVIANDKESRARDDKIYAAVVANQVSIAEMTSIKDDLVEIKKLLRRAAPFELKKDSM